MCLPGMIITDNEPTYSPRQWYLLQNHFDITYYTRHLIIQGFVFWMANHVKLLSLLREIWHHFDEKWKMTLLPFISESQKVWHFKEFQNHPKSLIIYFQMKDIWFFGDDCKKCDYKIDPVGYSYFKSIVKLLVFDVLIRLYSTRFCSHANIVELFLSFFFSDCFLGGGVSRSNHTLATNLTCYSHIRVAFNELLACVHFCSAHEKRDITTKTPNHWAIIRIRCKSFFKSR